MFSSIFHPYLPYYWYLSVLQTYCSPVGSVGGYISLVEGFRKIMVALVVSLNHRIIPNPRKMSFKAQTEGGAVGSLYLERIFVCKRKVKSITPYFNCICQHTPIIRR